uniref:Uncharacterized protein n=1 Tax=Magallana gigas TaxID=29159 RepID=K1R0C5_MAGGI
MIRRFNASLKFHTISTFEFSSCRSAAPGYKNIRIDDLGAAVPPIDLYFSILSDGKLSKYRLPMNVDCFGSLQCWINLKGQFSRQ